jgi:hypothetical protein
LESDPVLTTAFNLDIYSFDRTLMTIRVLLTRGLSNVRDAIDLIHRAMVPGEFHLGATEEAAIPWPASGVRVAKIEQAVAL